MSVMRHNRLVVLSIPCLLVISGCATMSGDPMKSANVTGNEVSVAVNNVWNANQAMKVADAHCQKYGRAARFTQKSGEYAFAFDCVKP